MAADLVTDRWLTEPMESLIRTYLMNSPGDLSKMMFGLVDDNVTYDEMSTRLLIG